MKILYVASEANPFIASGGLGDVMGALPKTIAKDNADAEVSVILPLYATMKQTYKDMLTKYCDISFRLSWRATGASVYTCELDGVRYYFLENYY